MDFFDVVAWCHHGVAKVPDGVGVGCLWQAALSAQALV